MHLATTKTLLVLCLLFICHQAFSQSQSDSIPSPLPTVQEEKKLNFGCGFGLNFVGGTSIFVAPSLSYDLNKRVAFALGVQGNYLALKGIQSTISYGASTQLLYNASKRISTLIEFTQLRVSTTTESTGETDNFWDSALFAGLEVIITNNLSAGAKYNFLYDQNKSIYSSPVIPFVNLTF